MTATIVNAAQAALNAKNFSKVRKASKAFSEVSLFGGTLTQRLQRHSNGNPRETYRKVDMFVAHNNSKELVEIGKLSETALILRNLDGKDREVCHLTPVCRASEVSKINNLSNLIVLLRETNQMINKRAIGRSDAETLDRMILAGYYKAAREFAAQRCF